MASIASVLVGLFLVVSLILYVLFGGADFGAGVLEIFKGTQRPADQQALISRAISPVWEANHIWLIIVVVILFMGFPPVYALLSVHLHIPLVLMLLGIVLRGCAFTFRHYDPSANQRLYTGLFIAGSVLSPLCFGVLVGSITAGHIDPQAHDAYALYVSPWLHGFGLLVGMFCLAAFVFLASAYLVGETEDPELQTLFVRRAWISNVVLILCGALVLISAQKHGVFTLRSFLLQPASGAAFVLATLLLAPLWFALKKRRAWIVRFLAATLVSVVIAGWLFTMYPYLIKLPQGGMTMAAALAPEPTLRQLAGALCVGLCLVIPALGFLLRLFKAGRDVSADG